MAIKAALGGISTAGFLVAALAQGMGYFLPAAVVIKFSGKGIIPVAVGAAPLGQILLGKGMLFMVEGYGPDTVGKDKNLIRLGLGTGELLRPDLFNVADPVFIGILLFNPAEIKVIFPQ